MMISGGTADRRGDVAYTDALVTGAQWVLVACAVWGGLVLVAATVELVTRGRTRALTWVAAPPVVRRLVLALLGAALVGVPTSGAIAAADPSATPSAAPPSPTRSALVVPGPDDLPAPARVAVDAPAPRPTALPRQASSEPTGRPHRVEASGSTRPAGRADPPARVRTTEHEDRGGGAGRATRRADQADQADRADQADQADQARLEAHTVRVAPGDCLWTLARRHLPPAATDAALAAWVGEVHQLNATAIGPDPDLLHPGTRLVLPAPS